MTPPIELAAALRHQAQGVHCLEAAAELLIAQTWLRRSDFTDRFVTLEHGLFDGLPTATVDWPAAITALDNGTLPCSAGEQRMLRIAASLADGVPVDLRQAVTGIDQRNVDLLVIAIRRAAGQRRSALLPESRGRDT
ncbi:hypothetical protein AB0F17_66205 [Nonomuraea sp. NPDC026600]|uniref:hypothetical protein n=1 Tax=Nonomuraea sp. NPDC026600 TaxID=3155363 RepID=UPI0033FBBA0F